MHALTSLTLAVGSADAAVAGCSNFALPYCRRFSEPAGYLQLLSNLNRRKGKDLLALAALN